MTTRATPITNLLLNDTVLGEWFQPLDSALENVNYSESIFRALPMKSFALSGCLRQLQSINTLIEKIQHLFHFDEMATVMPIARSTWSDALASVERRNILMKATSNLVSFAREQLPDTLVGVPGIGDRSVLAIDATYKEESTHYYRVKPSQGGSDNSKGHMDLTYYDVRKISNYG